ncbi:hypothetical protein BCT78_08195 [Vibrio breoganii]|nr:hypothetical protein BCT84_15455 [Vibrio breoganii]PML37159.1 hypothetical protein BCT78_08195 [Vibrio breoganii]
MTRTPSFPKSFIGNLWVQRSPIGALGDDGVKNILATFTRLSTLYTRIPEVFYQESIGEEIPDKSARG